MTRPCDEFIFRWGAAAARRASALVVTLLLALNAAILLAEPDAPLTSSRSVANRPLSLDDAAPVDHEMIALAEPAAAPSTIPMKSEQGALTPVVLAASFVGPPDPHPARSVALAPPAGAPSSDRLLESETVPADDPMIETILVSGQRADRLNIARNASAMIKLKVDADSVDIVEPTIADVTLVSPRQLVVTGRGYGTTQLVVRSGDRQRTFNVSVELDVTQLHELIGNLSPTADVHVRSVNGKLVLTGTVPDARTAEQVAEMAALLQGGDVKNQLVVAGVQQTMLRVVVAEVNKDAIRELGVNWAIGGADWTRNFFLANNLGQLNPTVFSSSGLTNVLLSNQNGGQLTYGVAPTANGPNTNITIGFPKAEFQLFLNALRQNSLSRVLAEPNLVAISGQTATFLAGGEVPIPVAQSGAFAGAITIEYKEFGIRLAFTPTVFAGQIIRLHVMSEVSDAVQGAALVGGLPIFTFTTRRVESTIECGNGQTFAIAGLLSERVRAVAAKIPGLGDLPVLGTLFSSTQYTKNNTELVVLVTPQLVEPLDPHQVPPPPGSLMTDPNDFELFTLQQLEGPPRRPPESEGVPRERPPVNTRPAEAPSWPSSQLALRGPWGLADFDEN